MNIFIVKINEGTSKINPYVPNVSFLYFQKTLENLNVLWKFYGVEKGYIGNKWIKESLLRKTCQNTDFL